MWPFKKTCNHYWELQSQAFIKPSVHHIASYEFVQADQTTREVLFRAIQGFTKRSWICLHCTELKEDEILGDHTKTSMGNT